MSTQPTAGAVGAANRIKSMLDLDGVIRMPNDYAEIIDREAHAKELADALEELTAIAESCYELVQSTTGARAITNARTALAKFQGGSDERK